MDEFEVNPDDHCITSGEIVRKGALVSVAMEWHMAHNLSDEYTSDFLKLRCRALQEVFGDMKHARGLLNVGREIKIIHRPKTCKVVMGFQWDNVDDTRWETIKTKFKDVFDPAALHGEACLHESKTGDTIRITSLFEVAEKGGD